MSSEPRDGKGRGGEKCEGGESTLTNWAGRKEALCGAAAICWHIHPLEELLVGQKGDR